jgi:hypothetical protein
MANNLKCLLHPFAVRVQARIGGGPAGDTLGAKLFNSSKQWN